MCWWYLGSAAQQAGYIVWKHSWKRSILIALSLSGYKMVEVRLLARETNILPLRGVFQLSVTGLPPGRKEVRFEEWICKTKTSLWLGHYSERCRYSSPGFCTRNCSLCPKQSLDKMHKQYHEQNNYFSPTFLYFSQLLHYMWQQKNSVRITYSLLTTS